MMDSIQGKHAELSVDKPDHLQKIAYALSSPVRLQIMEALGWRSMNVGELSERLDVPMSTTALAVKTLEEAGLITTEMQPGARGTMKLCSRKLDSIAISLVPEDTAKRNALVLTMPIGGYSVAEGIKATCGLANERNYIGNMDTAKSFYLPDRLGAQLIWFREGALEYRFAVPDMDEIQIDFLELSFEACSEAPMYRDPWKSDIMVSINQKKLGIWTSPCDCGGRRGKLTPDWWPDLSTQYGFLKTWRVNEDGAFLENTRIGDVTINDLALSSGDYILIRIEVAKDGENVGGMNLFGEHFGDFAQPIVLRLGYHMKETR